MALGVIAPLGVENSWSHRRRLVCCSLVILMAAVSPAAAQYHFDSWMAEDGLPHNWLKGILQTRDLILKEGPTNVAKHAGARHATLSVTTDGASLRCELPDDGRGFDRPTERGNGLANMHGRAAALGGCLDISSGAYGTTLRLEAQLARPARSKLRGLIAEGRMFMRRVLHAVRGTRGIMAAKGSRRSLAQHPFPGKDQP